ncbi:ABC transporter substrate-binding protein [Photobacterium atrarenae]|uniref:ABC transporter substrate-binding protein n=1 Tax=Photobacterium atrarenae TaxID=865757 RepID=A0ABY5GLY1_9GAMM|nr:ABC transporter substrate-binding protein [Photobacterium atrarenae]UTV29562.1 ABC transporter substrate-binding protein [Photobacterium atrarenae]
MRYWMALVFLRDHLKLHPPQPLSLDAFTAALACTKRNAQLVIKRLGQEKIIDWQPGIGRGNLPVITLLTPVADTLLKKARQLLAEDKVEQALSLIEAGQRDTFIANYIARYQTTNSQEDILKIPFYRGTHDLDPIFINRRTEQHIAGYLYAKLLQFNPATGDFRGDLAQHWQRNGNTLTLTLRKGLKFHDASPITAGDIQAHFERLIHSGHQNAALYQLIDRVEVLDPYRIAFTSLALPAQLEKLLANGPMGIAKFSGEPGNSPLVGSGSFLLAEQTPWRTLLKASPYYHGYRPWVDGVAIWNVGDQAMDFELNSDVVHSAHLKHRSAERFDAKTQWEKGAEYVLLNPNRPHRWLKKPAHRKALMAAIKALGVSESLREEGIGQAKGMLSDPTPIPVSDPAAATKILQSLPRPDQPLKLLTYQLDQHIALAKHLAENLTQLGIDCKYEVAEFPIFNQRETLQGADIILSGEVFGDDWEMDWLGWFCANLPLDVCLSKQQRQWLRDSILTLMQHGNQPERLKEFEQLEKQLISKLLYLPIFHARQNLNFSDKVSTTELLANGWIDFNTVMIQ